MATVTHDVAAEVHVAEQRLPHRWHLVQDVRVELPMVPLRLNVVIPGKDGNTVGTFSWHGAMPRTNIADANLCEFEHSAFCIMLWH